MRCLFFFTLRYNYLFQPYPTILFGRPHHNGFPNYKEHPFDHVSDSFQWSKNL